MTLSPTLRSTLITLTSFIFVITAVNAWTGPSVSAPDGNVSAPLTISSVSQSKAGGLDVGWLSAVGAVKVGYTTTACSAGIAGSLRWNTGVMEYCNGTVWGPFVGSASSFTETDPTVPAYVKDGTDWSEVTNKPASFPGAFSHVIENVNPTSCSNVYQLLCGSGKRGVTVVSSAQSEVQTGYSCMCFWN